MEIQKRIVDKKRHTIGYIVDGRRQTRGSLCDLIRRGHTLMVEGNKVIRKRGPAGWYLTTRPHSSARLYDLMPQLEVSTSVGKKAAR